MDGWSKALALAPGLVVSTAVFVVVGAALPGPAGLAVTLVGLACTAGLLSGGGERAAARLLWAARPPTAAELRVLAPAVAPVCQRGLGPPVVELRVRDRDEPTAQGLGRRTVVVSRGLVNGVQDGRVPADEAAAVLLHAAALVRAGMVRSDLAIRFWSLPWLALRGVTAMVLAAFGALPLTRPLWRAQGVVAAVAVAQAASQRYAAIGGVIAAMTLVSYAAPTWEQRWQRRLLLAGDHETAAHGMAPALARHLRRLPANPTVRERLARLEPGRDRAPVGLVETLR